MTSVQRVLDQPVCSMLVYYLAFNTTQLTVIARYIPQINNEFRNLSALREID